MNERRFPKVVLNYNPRGKENQDDTLDAGEISHDRTGNIGKNMD